MGVTGPERYRRFMTLIPARVPEEPRESEPRRLERQAVPLPGHL
jgi:hypothetical protein